MMCILAIYNENFLQLIEKTHRRGSSR